MTLGSNCFEFIIKIEIKKGKIEYTPRPRAISRRTK